jgi:hypothetical protein
MNPMDSRIAPSLLHPLSAKVVKVIFLRGRSSDSPAPLTNLPIPVNRNSGSVRKIFLRKLKALTLLFP